jgi:hypothetical protein
MQKIVALLVTEAELFASTINVQDVMYVKRTLESIKLKVELRMILAIPGE